MFFAGICSVGAMMARIASWLVSIAALHRLVQQAPAAIRLGQPNQRSNSRSRSLSRNNPRSVAADAGSSSTDIRVS